MGLYINPPLGQSKEDWLMKNSLYTMVKTPTVWNDRPGYLYVCHVLNATFTAAAIAYSAEEFAVLTDLNDPRFKSWFIVSIKRLKSVVPEIVNLPGLPKEK